MNNDYSLSAKKSLGQNFLKSKKAIYQMIDSAQTNATDTIIEIGPGKGALTRPILETGARVIAFELDSRMIDFLQIELSEYIDSGKLEIIHQDVLDIDMDSFFGKLGNYKVIANIPYYITNAIIRKFLETTYQPTDMSLLMQKEVAERIVVRDGKQSILALSVSVFGIPRYIAKVERKYFSPSPRVDSAIIHIRKISHQYLKTSAEQKIFFDIIHAGFAHKRKKLFKNLTNLIDKNDLEKIFDSVSLNRDIRAEKVPLNHWLKIIDIYYKNR